MAALIVLAACAGPKPPPGPLTFSSSGTAIVRGGPAAEVYLFGRGHVTVTRIDGTDLVDSNNNPKYRTIEIAAGLHAVHFNYRHDALCASGSACAMSLSRDRRLSLNAEAGHVYRVKATYRDGRLWAWIIDESVDLEVVSGELPDGTDWASGQEGFGGGQLF